MWRILRTIVAMVFPGMLRWRHTVTGIDNVPTDGSAVITWNHHSYVDYLMLGVAVYDGRGRVTRFLGKSEIWDSPVLAWIADHASAVPVFRGKRGGGGAFRAAIDALRNGDLVGVAPEQTISQSFELLPFATGAARMAQEAGAPVVPSVGWGSHRFMTKGHTLNLDQAWRLPVWTVFGEPIHIDPDEDIEAATERIRAATQRLLHEVQRAYPERPSSAESSWWLPARLGGAAPEHATVLAEHETHMRHRSRQAT